MSFILSRKFKTAALILVSILVPGSVLAQAGRASATPPTPKAAAPIDLTGYWVAIVTQDWRFRMVTPARGDYASVPINLEAKKVADAWDPAKDEAAGEQCKSYGAPALLRIPGRLHITWQDDNTLKVEADAGTQTRLLHFGDWQAPGGAATWQGDSHASWEIPRVPGRNAQAGTAAKAGDLKVMTSHLRPGYLRKNGIPYSADTTMTEYWDVLKETHLSAPFNGEQWIVVTTIVDDPKYLQTQWMTSLQFRKEADGSKWDPQPCSSRW